MIVAFTSVVVNQSVALGYSRHIWFREFRIMDLLLWTEDIGNKNARDGKLSANREGLHRMQDGTRRGRKS